MYTPTFKQHIKLSVSSNYGHLSTTRIFTQACIKFTPDHIDIFDLESAIRKAKGHHRANVTELKKVADNLFHVECGDSFFAVEIELVREIPTPYRVTMTNSDEDSVCQWQSTSLAKALRWYQHQSKDSTNLSVTVIDSQGNELFTWTLEGKYHHKPGVTLPRREIKRLLDSHTNYTRIGANQKTYIATIKPNLQGVEAVISYDPKTAPIILYTNIKSTIDREENVNSNREVIYKHLRNCVAVCHECAAQE